MHPSDARLCGYQPQVIPAGLWTIEAGDVFTLGMWVRSGSNLDTTDRGMALLHVVDASANPVDADGTDLLLLFHFDVPEGGAYSFVNTSMMHTDPPDHTRLRSQIKAPFTKQRAAKLEPDIRRIVRDQLGLIAERGDGDALNDLSQPVATRVTCFVLGLPESDAPKLEELVNLIFAREPGTTGLRSLVSRPSASSMPIFSR